MPEKPVEDLGSSTSSTLATRETENVESVAVEVVEKDEELNVLSPEEQERRVVLEAQVDKSFHDAVMALREIRDKRLYRSTHATFEEYCPERFGYGKRYAYHLINASYVIDNIEQENVREQSELRVHLLPSNEYQIRPLVDLEPSIQFRIWSEAVTRAKGKTPSQNSFR